jgi:short-subunit dehydrogenase
LRRDGEFIEKYATTDSHHDDTFSTKRLRQAFETNFFGLMDVTNAALPYLRRSEAGRMVVIGSQSAWTAGVPVSAAFNC